MSYTLIKRRGLKNLTLRVGAGGVKIYAPKRTPQRVIDGFWNMHKDKIPRDVSFESEYVDKKEEAREILLPLVDCWADTMNLSYNQMRIKDTRSRWGSCSTKRNLNFSYKVAYLPKPMREYIIIHELAHLVHMNHSVDFWSLVQMYCPHYRDIRKELRNVHKK